LAAGARGRQQLEKRVPHAKGGPRVKVRSQRGGDPDTMLDQWRRFGSRVGGGKKRGVQNLGGW